MYVCIHDCHSHPCCVLPLLVIPSRCSCSLSRFLNISSMAVNSDCTQYEVGGGGGGGGGEAHISGRWREQEGGRRGGGTGKGEGEGGKGGKGKGEGGRKGEGDRVACV